MTLAKYMGSRSDARIAEHPVASSLAIWRAESHKPYAQDFQKLVCVAVYGEETACPVLPVLNL